MFQGVANPFFIRKNKNPFSLLNEILLSPGLNCKIKSGVGFLSDDSLIFRDLASLFTAFFRSFGCVLVV